MFATHQERLPNKKAQKFPLRRSSVQMAGRGELEVIHRLEEELAQKGKLDEQQQSTQGGRCAVV